MRAKLIPNSDSLQRHLARHGDVFKPAPSGRSKRACLACRAGKVKCDGNDKCSTCVKKCIDCKYRQEDQASEEPNEQQQRQPADSTPNEQVESDGDAVMILGIPGAALPTATPIQSVPEVRRVSDVFKLPGPTGLVDCKFSNLYYSWGKKARTLANYSAFKGLLLKSSQTSPQKSKNQQTRLLRSISTNTSHIFITAGPSSIGLPSKLRMKIHLWYHRQR